MPKLDLCEISAEQTHPLRNRVLRPGKPVSACRWPGDDDPDSFHAGAFVDGKLVAIATVIPEAMPQTDPSAAGPLSSFRLRGMATQPQSRRKGYGSALLEFAIERTREAGADLLWCHARTPAVAFYRRAGFEILGDPFDVPGIGPHVRMWLDLHEATAPSATVPRSDT